jgi:hypothetical protein
VAQLGANVFVLEPGRVPDCYLGLLLDPAGEVEVAGVLVVAPAALLHPIVPQPDGTALHELVTATRPDTTRAGIPARPHLRAARLALWHLGHA